MEEAVKYFTIERFSHHFVLTPHVPRGQEIVMNFASNYVQMGLVKIGRVFRRMPVKVFAARCPKRREVRFHHGQWNEFMSYLKGIGLTERSYVLKEYGYYESDAVDLKISDGWSPRDYQIPIIDYLSDVKPSPIKLLEIQTGKGKAHPNEEPIKTPDGWTTVGELKAGDLVIDDVGLPVEVSAVYPQGEQDTYQLSTTDGRFSSSTLDHLWSIVLHDTATGELTPHTLSLREVMGHMGQFSKRVLLPLPEPIAGKNTDLPFCSWTIGALVSSGYFAKDKEGQSVFRVILKSDYAIETLGKNLKKVGYDLKPDGRHAFIITKENESWTDTELYRVLASGDAERRKCKRAFIPKAYFESSVGSRQAFVSGVMDACGTINSSAQLVLSTIDEIFSEDFVYMVRSLGDKVFVRRSKKQYKHVIHTMSPDNYFETPSLREASLMCSATLHTRFVELKGITYNGRSQCTCFSIDNDDGLYVVSDFLLSHNTYSAAEAIVRNGKRFAIFLKPQFIEKWVGDLKKLMGFEDDDIAVIKGSASMMQLITEAIQGDLPYKAIIISNKTFQNWLTAYEEEGDALLEKGYDCHPHQLLQLLKVGLRLIDEVHMDFHLNFKIDLYTHCERSISLSATLISDDAFISTMQSIAYPKYLRYSGLAYDKYVTSYAMLYKLANGVRIQTSEQGSGGKYSHHAFEKSLYRSTALMKSFLGLIELTVKRYFTERKGVVKGDRCLVYVSSIQFATEVVGWLLKRFPGYDIRRYVEDDPYENLMEAEISVSTVGSAGTGHDIDSLVTVILTTAISSSSSNIQGFGRLRNLAGKDMVFVYYCCEDIDKHVQYHEKKNLMLGWMAKEKSIVHHPEPIG